MLTVFKCTYTNINAPYGTKIKNPPLQGGLGMSVKVC
jgi:hypothetical protein